MTVERINLGPVEPLGATVRRDVSPEGAAQGIAQTVAERILSELGVGGDARPTGAPDAYRLGDLANRVGLELGATPSEAGELTRAIEALAGALAEDLVALADGRTLDRLDTALASTAGEGPADVSAFIRVLEGAAAAIAESR